MEVGAVAVPRNKIKVRTAVEERIPMISYLYRPNVLQSVFLRRTLSYMKHRTSRTNKSRVGFKVDNILPVTQARLEQEEKNFAVCSRKLCEPIKYYNVYLLGLSDGQPWSSDTSGKVAISFCNKRAMIEKTVSVPIFSPACPHAVSNLSLPKTLQNRKHRVISFPAESCPFHDPVDKYELEIKVSIRGRIGKSPTCPYEYAGTIVLYENGENRFPGNFMETDLGVILPHVDRQERDIRVEKAGNAAKLWIGLRTSSEPSRGYAELPPPLRTCAGHGVKQAEAPVRLRYHLISPTSPVLAKEKREDWICPLCALDCFKMYTLFKHLTLCHPGLLFNFRRTSSGGAKVNLVIDQGYEFGTFNGLPHGKTFFSNGPSRTEPRFSMTVCHPAALDERLDEFFKPSCDPLKLVMRSRSNKGKEPRDKVPSGTSNDWVKVFMRRRLEEFVDVNEGELEMMTLWNNFLLDHPFSYIGDLQLPKACREFVRLHGKKVIEKKLYANCSLHFTNLFDMGVLSKGDMAELCKALQKCM